MAASARKTAKTPQPMVPPSGFEELVRSVELIGVHLVSSNSSCGEHALPPDFHGDLEVVHRSTKFAYQVHNNPEVLQCGVKLGLDVGPALKEAKPVASLEAEYTVLYRLPDGFQPSTEAIKFFAATNAVFNAWPFFRELVHSLVARMGMPPLMVPLLKLPPTVPK